MSAQWYYQTGGETRGPVELEKLRRLAREGGIGPATPVHREGEDWVLARQVRGLIEEVTADMPPAGAAIARPPAAYPDEDYAAPALAAQKALPADPIGDWYQGGPFCSSEFDGDPDLAAT